MTTTSLIYGRGSRRCRSPLHYCARVVILSEACLRRQAKNLKGNFNHVVDFNRIVDLVKRDLLLWRTNL